MTTGTPLSPPFKVLFRMRPFALAPFPLMPAPLMPAPLTLAPLTLARLVLAPLVLAAGCVPTTHHHAALHIAPALAQPAHQAPWWQDAGDPLLAQLIDRGVAQDPDLSCQAAALTAREAKAHARKIKARLTRLIAPRDDAAHRLADSYTLAQARSRLAASIALAYIDARRWQERITLRAHALEPLRDNADIAHFRREAGLVAALDGDMADLMTGLDTASLDAARAHLADAIADLARLTGALPDDLRVLLGPDGHIPTLGAEPGVAEPGVAQAGDDLSHRPDLLALDTRLSADLARHNITQATIDTALAAPDDTAPSVTAPSATADAIALWRKAETGAHAELQSAQDAQRAATARLAPLDPIETLAMRARGDARLAYRNGTETFATLYVAEGVALAAHERRVDANAAIARAAIALWTAQGKGWQDLKSGSSTGTACGQP